MSTDLLQRYAKLEAENADLRARLNGHGYPDAEKLLEAIAARIERSGQLLREDFTGKLAGLISPYIDSTLRRCSEVEKQQGELEKKFEEHRKAVAAGAADLEAAFVKMRKEAAKDWKAQREQIQADLGRVDEFVRWYNGELEKRARANQAAISACAHAARTCEGAVAAVTAVAQKMDVPVEQATERLGQIEAEGAKIITRAAQRLSKAYEGLREPVLARVTALLCATVLIHLAFAAFTVWGTRRALDTNWQELAAHSEQQKQEMRGLLDRAMEEAKESQIDREAKVKMWDELMKTLPAQQRQGLIERLRQQFYKAGEKRLGDQMSSSYDQMNGKK